MAVRRQRHPEGGTRRARLVRRKASSIATDPFEGTVYEVTPCERLLRVVGSAVNEVSTPVRDHVAGSCWTMEHSLNASDHDQHATCAFG